MKKPLLFLAILTTTTPAFAAEKILSCVPQEIQNFPKNAIVKIERVSNAYRMTVTTQFYGAYLDENTT